MADLTADNNPVIVDKEAKETNGKTVIHYRKEALEELWERYTLGSWSPINVHERTGLGDKADFDGTYQIVLKPGEVYEVAVYEAIHGPLSTDPILRTALKVFCLWKKPEVRKLITDQNSETGGTWHHHQVATNVPTNIVTIAASRQPPFIDSAGIPYIKSPDGGPTQPLTFTNNHSVDILPLFAGHHYFFIVVVADTFGNWEVVQQEFTTLRRKLTVEFPTIHIYNDGDPFGHGEGEFWFRVYKGESNQPEVIEDFHLPTQDIDDWSETDRPYPVGFSHVGEFEVVQPGKAEVKVSSWAIEHDGAFESNEGAASIDRDLQLPAGPFVENVTNSSLLMDCPTSTDDDFHYGVEVRWSVEYGA